MRIRMIEMILPDNPYDLPSFLDGSTQAEYQISDWWSRVPNFRTAQDYRQYLLNDGWQEDQFWASQIAKQFHIKSPSVVVAVTRDKLRFARILEFPEDEFEGLPQEIVDKIKQVAQKIGMSVTCDYFGPNDRMNFVFLSNGVPLIEVYYVIDQEGVWRDDGQSIACGFRNLF